MCHLRCVRDSSHGTMTWTKFMRFQILCNFLVFPVLCAVVGDTSLQGSWGDCISTSRLGERATPRVMHAAIATAREEGDRQWHWTNAYCTPGSVLGNLYTLSHLKRQNICEVYALLFSFYKWKYWDLTPKLTCPPIWDFELESVWLWSPSSFLCAINTNLP